MNPTHQVGPETLLPLACVLLLTGCTTTPTDQDDLGSEPLVGHALGHRTTDTPPEPGPVPTTDGLKDMSGEDLIRILPDGYLSVLSNSSEHNRVRYELRDYDGTVRHTISTDAEVTRGRAHSFVPLEESPVKLRMVDEDEEQDIAVLDWDTDNDHRIPLDIEVDTAGILSSDRLDREVGPMTFREVPGAVAS